MISIPHPFVQNFDLWNKLKLIVKRLDADHHLVLEVLASSVFVILPVKGKVGVVSTRRIPVGSNRVHNAVPVPSFLRWRINTLTHVMGMELKGLSLSLACLCVLVHGLQKNPVCIRASFNSSASV